MAKSYSNIINHLFYQPLLLTPARHAALLTLLELRLSGQIAGAGRRKNGLKADNDEEFSDDDELPGAGNPDADQENQARTDGDTVIIPVHGTLVAHPEDIAMSECGCSMESLGCAIDAAENDSTIKRMVFDYRTPGGSVTMIPETARKIRNSKKETVGFTDCECCSGGMWLMSACQKAYSTSSARLGSVGVYTMCMDYTGMLKQDGVKVNAIFAGKYKLLGAYWKPLSDDERQILQDGVDKIYAEFKDAMEANRVVSDEHFGNGLVFDGEDAANMGFTNGVVEDMEEVLEML